jgi:hypothetical protein
MGRTVPTFRQLIDDAIARWSKIRCALRREDQKYFDRMFRRVRTYTQPATYQASDNPMEAILFSIAIEQAIEYIITDSDNRVPNDRVRVFALWDGWFGSDRRKYT